MSRLLFLCLRIFFSLAAATLSLLSHAQTAKKEKPEEFSLLIDLKGGGSQEYSTRFIEKEVLNPDGDEKISIVLEVTFYTGYSWAADADSTSRTCHYTLQRVGAPEKQGDYEVVTWKLLKTEGEDLLKDRLQDTVKMSLVPEIRLYFFFLDMDYINLESELMEKDDPYDDY